VLVTYTAVLVDEKIITWRAFLERREGSAPLIVLMLPTYTLKTKTKRAATNENK
jgi:hypothetical protein